MDFELKESQLGFFLISIVLILVGFIVFSEAPLWQTETTTVQSNSENTYQSDTREIMAVYQTNYSIDWGPNVENDYGYEDDFAQSWYGIVMADGEGGCMFKNGVCYAMGAYAKLMHNLASVLYLIVLLGTGFLFFSSTPNAFENINSASLIKKIGISIALISILMSVHFMLESVSIREELAEEYGCDYITGPCVEPEGFWGSDTWEGDTNSGSQNFDTLMEVKWGPGLAWYLMALVIPLLSLAAVYFSSDENEESDLVNYLPFILFLFALVSLSLVVHPETYGNCGWGCSYDAGEGPFGSEEKQFDHRFYLYAGEIIALILVISGLLISSWITYRLSSTGESPTLSIEYIVPENSSRLLALFSIIPIKSILLLIHRIIQLFFTFVALIMMLIGLWGSLLFGRYPESSKNWILSSWRWNWRIGSYANCLTDAYPPFSILEDYPTDITFDEREGGSRSKLLTLYGSFLGGKFILLLPCRIILLFYSIIAGIAAFLGPFVVLLLGKYPESWMNFIIKTSTQGVRINAYTMCLTEVFPPLYPGDGYIEVPKKTSSLTNQHYDALMSDSIVETHSQVEKRPSIDDNSDSVMKDLVMLKNRAREICILFFCLTFVFIILDSTFLCCTSGIIFVVFLLMAIFGKNENDPVQVPESAAKPFGKKTFTPKKKKVKAFKPKAELIDIECPGCEAQMKVAKLNELQEVTCKECGLSGEIEI